MSRRCGACRTAHHRKVCRSMRARARARPRWITRPFSRHRADREFSCCPRDGTVVPSHLLQPCAGSSVQRHRRGTMRTRTRDASSAESRNG